MSFKPQYGFASFPCFPFGATSAGKLYGQISCKHDWFGVRFAFSRPRWARCMQVRMPKDLSSGGEFLAVTQNDLFSKITIIVNSQFDLNLLLSLI